MIYGAVLAFYDSLSLQEAFVVLQPLLMFVVGMAVYSFFIFHFYKFLARRDIFELDLQKYNTAKLGLLRKFISSVLYVVKYALFFPILTFFSFLVLALILTLLAKTPTAESILMISIAVVSAVRITAYYNEDLSRDLAKMLPFALLAVFLVDISYFSFSDAYAVLVQLPAKTKLLAYYLSFVILLEFVLRMVSTLVRGVFPQPVPEKQGK